MIEPKEYFMEQVASELGFNNQSKILELGSGQSRAMLPLLQKFPEMVYVGVEPSPKDAAVATELLKPFKNAKIINSLAYEKLPGSEPFDVCLSLSVLEHVKQLEKFLVNSIESVKNGGHIVHRYDLGHALYPNSVKEKIQVFFGTHFPTVLPEHKFVCYLAEDTVRGMLEKNGVQIQKMTYHQMPNHKAFLKQFNPRPEQIQIIKEIFDWEIKVSPFLGEMKVKQRELLFPTITFWGVKQ